MRRNAESVAKVCADRNKLRYPRPTPSNVEGPQETVSLSWYHSLYIISPQCGRTVGCRRGQGCTWKMAQLWFRPCSAKKFYTWGWRYAPWTVCQQACGGQNVASSCQSPSCGAPRLKKGTQSLSGFWIFGWSIRQRTGSLLWEFVHKIDNVRSGSSYQRQRKMASNLILEVPPYGSEGFRLSDNNEVDGGARRVEKDWGDQALEIIWQLCLISHLQQLSSNLQVNQTWERQTTWPPSRSRIPTTWSSTVMLCSFLWDGMLLNLEGDYIPTL